MVKREAVHGGCLGAIRRRRPWQAAKNLGEKQTFIDPRVAEWGNPAHGRGESLRDEISSYVKRDPGN